jgi:hypothetical protein
MDNYKILQDQIFDLLMSFNFTNFVLVIIFDFLISKFFSPCDSGHCTSQHSKGAQTRDYVSLLRNQLSLLEELHTTFLSKTCLLGSSCLMVIPEHGVSNLYFSCLYNKFNV